MNSMHIIPCGCCREDVSVVLAVMDTELQAHVCPTCRSNLRDAKAQLARPCDSLCQTIAIRGVYRGADAPDNRPPAEPPTL